MPPLEARDAANAVAENAKIEWEKDRPRRERLDAMAAEHAAMKAREKAAADAAQKAATQAREADADAALDQEVRRVFDLGNPSGSDATFLTVRDELRRSIILRRSDEAFARARRRAMSNF